MPRAVTMTDSVMEIITLTQPVEFAGRAPRLPTLFVPNEKAGERFFGFFTENIRNPNTRRAYYKAVCRFADWCEERELVKLGKVKPMHVAAYVEVLGRPAPEGAGLSKPS